MTIGIIAIIMLLVLVGVGLPVAISLLLIAICGLVSLIGFEQTLAASAPLFYNYIAKYEFSVIPMFVLLGNLGYYSGMVSEVFEVARKWFGRLPAGLAVSVVIAQVIFGACSGSTVAACVVIGKASIPIMRKAGYPDHVATGVVAGSGTLAALIPPSITICIYGLLVDESIGKLLLGGFLPGFLSAGVFIFFIMLQASNVPRDTARYSFREKIISLRYLWVVIGLVFAIMGGIYSGICTATEAAGVGTFVIFVMTLVTKRFTWQVMWNSIRATVVTTGMILIIIISAVLFGRFLTICGFSSAVTSLVAALTWPAIYIFIIVVIVYLIFGCFIGATGMMVMTLPVFYPIMMNLGYNSIWFGIIVVIMCEMAFLTPPVGINLYATRSVAPDVPLTTIIRGVWPYVFRDLIVVVILYIFPNIVTFLPDLMLGR